GDAKLSLLGMEPTYPSEKYGYIMPVTKEQVSKVASFKEKPDKDTAQKYIDQGALWNGGVFAFSLGYLLACAEEQLGARDYEALYNNYENLKKISFDYAVVEKEKNIQVLRYRGEWKDIGTWNTFAEAMGTKESQGTGDIGKVIQNETCVNTNVVNELNIPILCMGCKDMIIAASSDGILVSDKEQSSYIKPYVEQLGEQIMFAEKSWGSFTVLDVGENSMTIRVILQPDNKLYYHSHSHRDEVWTITSGTGTVVTDGKVRAVEAGDVIEIPAGCKHTIMAKSELKIIEVQMGRDISVEDKVKYPHEDWWGQEE
ncbi:cupin domain-containing protein, partial [Lachnospiraceae bacterium OttesenSCG-928-D06]|nr:cupin domain-containing protein [Lachnospiraceae bacterium OttesenSCG-928-D06]